MISLKDKWPYDFVEIEWDDAANSDGWEIATDLTLKEELVTTIGFLVKKTRKHLLVAASLSVHAEDEYHTNTRQQIPRGMVKSMRVLVPKNTEPVAPSDPFSATVGPGGNA